MTMAEELRMQKERALDQLHTALDELLDFIAKKLVESSEGRLGGLV